MRSIKDIKILLFLGYVIGYPLAVAAPIFIDPLLKSHVIHPSRHYPYAFACLPIYFSFLIVQSILLRRGKTLSHLYLSVCVYLSAIFLSLPIFLPEFPHGNLISVGIATAFLSAFSIFVWSIGDHISLDSKSLNSAGFATFEYMKTLLSFVRQGAYAGVALFGALFLTSYATGFKYVESTVTDKSDVFLLNANIAFQIGFYAIFSVAGPVRYFFIMNLQILAQFKSIAARLDRKRPKARNHGSSE